MKIIVIGGPTGSGKTEIALTIARELNGELISADSRQVYKYLDVGTNKYIDQKIPIHLINLIEPNERFDVYDFKILVEKAIEDISARGKLPILVGGTGLYIDAVIKDYKLEESSNNTLRDELGSKSIGELQELLKIKNSTLFEKLNYSDQNNPRRLIRLIQKDNFANNSTKAPNVNSKYDFLFLYPEYDWEELKLKIAKRVEQMFKDGLIEEVEKALELGYQKEDPGLQIMGYKQIIEHLEGKYDLDQCKELIKIAHRQYAKRQRTWFESGGRNYKLVKADKNSSLAIVAKFAD